MKAGTKGSLALAAAALAIVAVGAMPAGASNGAPDRAKRAGCDISGQQQDLGASYVTSVKAKNVSCGKALKVVQAYHKCRKDNGGRDGRCGGVKGYSCSEKRESAPSQYNAKAKCTKGSKKVVQTYTQNT
jgi:hypothetical protein